MPTLLLEMPVAGQNSVNHASYQRYVAEYDKDDRLMNSEVYLLAAYPEIVRGKRLLDLGVGTGRTAHVLPHLAQEYVATDYSPAMVEAFRQRFASLTCYHDDARAMQFADASFDTVVFSFNGLDSVDHAARLKILSEVRRVLVPGGYFLFSSHNREQAYTWTPKRFPRNPWRWWAALQDRRRTAANQARNRSLERQTPEYAIVNDPSHEYSMVLYYITAEAQRRQLEQAGFTLIESVRMEQYWNGYLAQKV